MRRQLPILRHHANFSLFSPPLEIRIFAASIAGTKFTEGKAETWRTHVAAILDVQNPGELRSKFSTFELEHLTCRSAQIDQSGIISAHLLSDCVLALEDAIRTRTANILDVATPSELTLSATRIDAVHQALFLYAPRPIDHVLKEIAHLRFSTAFQNVTFNQRGYLVLYFHIFNDLRGSERLKTRQDCGPACSYLWKHPDLSAAELAAAVLRLITHDAPAIPSPSITSASNAAWKKWVRDVHSPLRALQRFSHETLASWLGNIARQLNPVLEFSPTAILEMVKRNTGIDVVGMGFRPLVEPDNKSSDVTLCTTSEKSALSTSRILDDSVMREDQRDCISISQFSTASSFTSTSSSFKAFKKLVPLRRSAKYTSQGMLPPSSFIRRSLQSDWSLQWRNSISDLSASFSKSSISLRESLVSK